MIKIDFATAIAFFLILQAVLVMVFWVIYNCNGKKVLDIHHSTYFRQCPYCCFVYFDYQKGSLRCCPQCKSLIEHQGV